MAILEAMYIRQCIDLLDGLLYVNKDVTSMYFFFHLCNLFVKERILIPIHDIQKSFLIFMWKGYSSSRLCGL